MAATRSTKPSGGRQARPEAERHDAVRALAQDLLASSNDIARLMAERLHERIPDVNAHDELLETTVASCRSNIAQILRLLARGESVDLLVVPPEAIEYARTYVQRGISLAALLRAYRLGQEYLWDEWLLRAMSARIEDREMLAEAVEAVSAYLFAYIDRICDQLVGEYGTARDQWVRSAAATRADTAHQVLAGAMTDDGLASARLGYELRLRHVGLMLWSDAGATIDAFASPEATAADVAGALGCDHPLVIPAGTGILWAWCSCSGDVDSAAVQALETSGLRPGLRLAIGRPAAGINGFRSTHREAREAARIARLAGSAAARVTPYSAVELVSLLAVDVERARAFVHHELGALAAADEHAERLRETLYVFLDEGMSRPRTAQRLSVHGNTVSYRVSRALEVLDKPVEGRHASLAAALLLARVLRETLL